MYECGARLRTLEAAGGRRMVEAQPAAWALSQFRLGRPASAPHESADLVRPPPLEADDDERDDDRVIEMSDHRHEVGDDIERQEYVKGCTKGYEAFVATLCDDSDEMGVSWVARRESRGEPTSERVVARAPASFDRESMRGKDVTQRS